MNWVGGTRSRIKTQNEKKLQREFFERKKFSEKVQVHRSFGSSGIRKQGLGKDFRAFQTVNIAHSNHNGIDSSVKRPVKKVDLEVSKPMIPRMVEDIDLGPTSPSSEISKISLMEPKYEKRKRPTDSDSLFAQKDTFMDYNVANQSNSVKFEPFSSPNPYKFKKPGPVVNTKFTDFEKQTSVKFGHKDLEPETPMLQSFQHNSNTDPYKILQSDAGHSLQINTKLSQHMSYSKHNEISISFSEKASQKRLDMKFEPDCHAKHFNSKFTTHSRNKNMYTTTKKISLKRPFINTSEKNSKESVISSGRDLFISEDFQCTPLQSYQRISSSPSVNSFKTSDLNNNHSYSKKIHDRVFSSADFIQTPFKDKKFSSLQSPSRIYPKTSTPRYDTLHQLSPEIDSILSKGLKTPDIHMDAEKVQEKSLFTSGVKELFHLPDLPLHQVDSMKRQDIEKHSPQVGSVFPCDMLQNPTNYESAEGTCNSSYSSKIKLKKSPRGLQNNPVKKEIQSGGLKDAVVEKDSKENKVMKTTTQMEEVLAEITELENEDFPDVDDELDIPKENAYDTNCKENYNSFNKDQEIMDADSKQEKVNRDIVSRILNNIISQIENTLDNTLPIGISHLSVNNRTSHENKQPETEDYQMKDNCTSSNHSCVETGTCTSETQTDEKLFVDMSTSPMLLSHLTVDEGIQCSISRGISPVFCDEQAENSNVISRDLRVIPLKQCYVKIDEEVNLDVKQEVKSENYCLRSRKSRDGIEQ